ncbi:MAG: exo-beta-N-acetylmuramidase NamZ family protein [Luteibaculaceae bacterium]
MKNAVLIPLKICFKGSQYPLMLIGLFVAFSSFACSDGATEIVTEETASVSDYQIADSVPVSANSPSISNTCDFKPAAYQTDTLRKLLANKKVALVGNHSSLVNNVHLVDTLLALGVNLVKVFAPEHGFRGDADAGAQISSTVDEKTGLPLVSLYGKTRKPTAEMLKDVDLIIFDIQDVGVRYYTYISTMHYTMEAAAEYGVAYLVLDRPNPNGFYIDGPLLESKFKSFVGLHPVPVVHGLTVGEYANMIMGEGWINSSEKLNLSVLPMPNYSKKCFYQLEVRPSPNLPNMESVYLYPSLGFFEGTSVSVGRGTSLPFQQIGHPSYSNSTYSFIPKPTFGAKNPPHNGKLCYGYVVKLGNSLEPGTSQLTFQHLVNMYQGLGKPEKYFNNFFANLMGTQKLNQAIYQGASDSEIRAIYEKDLEEWNNAVRKKYLLYPDFN